MSISTPSAASQCKVILAALRAGRGITPIDALREFACFRLAARVYDLREDGHNIVTLWQSTSKKRWAVYRMFDCPCARCRDARQ